MHGTSNKIEKLSLYTLRRHIRGGEGSGGMVHPFLMSALDGGELSVLHRSRFTSRAKTDGAHWTGAAWGPQPVRTLQRNKKTLALTGVRVPNRSARKLVTTPPTLPLKTLTVNQQIYYLFGEKMSTCHPPHVPTHSGSLSESTKNSKNHKRKKHVGGDIWGLFPK